MASLEMDRPAGAPRQGSRRHTEIADSILDAIGETPLVRLSRLGAGLPCELLAKVESFNPGGSIKDRAALSMLEAAERDGLIGPGSTIVEPTSGNTGLGLALAGCLRGYRVIAVMPDKMSREKIDLLRAYGAEVVITPTEVPPDSPDSYYSVANRLTAEIPRSFQPNQYQNPANPDAHLRTTGPELWRQSGGRITHFVASVGTGGTISGVGRYLKSRDPSIQVIGADPVGSVFSGGEPRPYLVEGIGKSTWPATLDRSVVDRFVAVSDRDSFLTARRLTRTEGILAGGSAGTALFVALAVARGAAPGAVVAVVIPDSGRSYLSKQYNDAWMADYGFLERSSADRTVGQLLRDKHAAAEVPPLVRVESHSPLKDAVALLHEHRVSQLPVVSPHDRHAIVGSVSERGLLRQALLNPSLLELQVMNVMDPPFPAVAVEDSLLDAVELLSGEREAVTVTEGGRPVGILTRADLLEAFTA